MFKLTVIGTLGFLISVAVFFSYGTDTAGQRWQLLSAPTPLNNRFLPDEVNSAITCLKRIEAKEYRAVGEMKTDYHFFQRIAEGAWPIRANEKSSLIVGKSSDILCSKFDSLCSEGLVRVGICSL